MSDKHKNNETNIFETAISRVALGTMAVAALAGLVEGDEFKHLAVVPIMAVASQVDQQIEPITEHVAGPQFVRREKEEVGHRAVSYGVSMRTHASAGRA